MVKNQKLNVLKKCIGRRYVILKDQIKNNFYFGQAKDIVDENHLLILKNDNTLEKVNIFDIRAPSKDYV